MKVFLCVLPMQSMQMNLLLLAELYIPSSVRLKRYVMPRMVYEIKEHRLQDVWGILLLLVLYTLQGIPMGLGGSVPFLLQQREV